ncbi:MAG: ribosome maturation factor RimM [Kineosporiaceae bacterium]
MTVRLLVARVGRAHGIRGEVTVQVHTDAPDVRFAPGTSLHTPTGVLTVRSVRDHNGTLLLGFEQIEDRSAAEALRGTLLEADVDPALEHEREDDAWYDHELIGLRAIDVTGAELGRVIAVEHLPAQDLLEIARPDGATRLVPFVAAIVPTVDVEAGHVVLDAPPGLLDD